MNSPDLVGIDDPTASSVSTELSDRKINREKNMAGKKALADLLAPVRWQMRVGLLLGALSGVLGAVPYIYLAKLGAILLDAARQGIRPDAEQVNGAIVMLLAAFFGRVALYLLALLITHLADVSLNRSIRARIMDKVGRVPLTWFGEYASGQLRKVMQDDVKNLHVMVAHRPVDYTFAIVMPLSLLCYAFYLDWRLGLLSVSIIPLYLILYAIMMRDMGEKTIELDARLDQLSATMVEFVAGIGVVKAFGIVGKAHERYRRHANDTCDFYLAWVGPMLRGSALTTAIISAPVVMFITFSAGSFMARAGMVSVIDVVTVSLIALVIPGAIENFGNLEWGKRFASAAARRILEIIDQPQLSAPEKGPIPADAQVDFEQVTLRYGETLAIDDVSLTLKPHTVTALIGPSGSGKSSLAKLVARFQDPTSGIVRIGGVDLREMSEQELYCRVGFVLQDAQLLRASIADNIRLACPHATDEQVWDAARHAHIHDEIVAFEAGYDTVVGKDVKLSGGQEQRIAIARAILANRPILILDEATAMVDPDSEAEIQRALNELVVGKTVLVIAHRPASIRGADQIVILDGGRIVARGTHEEIKDHPHYRHLWEKTVGVERTQR